MTEDRPLLVAPGFGSGLQAHAVTRAYSGVVALNEASIVVPRGQVTGLIGANGAGKSTLVNILSGYDLPDTGRVTVDGVDITRERPARRARRGIARTFQHGHLYRRLTVQENVEVAALSRGVRRSAAREEAIGILSRLQLVDWAIRDADRLPHGVERRLGVARALALRPDYVLFDEPAAGLNDGEAEHFRDIMRDLATDGLGVLLIDHNMPLVFGACDHIWVLGAGRNVMDDVPRVVRADERVAATYLGAVAGAGHD